MKRHGNDIKGLMALNKPSGMSSNQALQKVKRMLHAKKAGHTGTLDPMASGVLPLCFGQATKITQFLLDAEKSYEATIQLGMQTETGDAEGSVVYQAPVDKLETSFISNVLRQYIGEIEQTVPMYSAVKKYGKPMYHWAQTQNDIQPKSKQVIIYDIHFKHYDACNDQITLAISCSKGTYIRRLAENIAESLSSVGYLNALTRLSCGPLSLKDTVDLETLERNCFCESNITTTQTENFSHLKRYFLPIEMMFEHNDIYYLSQKQYDDLMKSGKFKDIKNTSNGLYRLYSPENQFLGVVNMHQNQLIKKQLFN
jgi:tRNA pseudouridine55 synthase